MRAPAVHLRLRRPLSAAVVAFLAAPAWLLGSTRLAAAAPVPAALPGSIAELLESAQVPSPKLWHVYQASGYDRDGGFYDSGNFLRVETNRQYVLMGCDGPGVIDRMWFTYKSEFRGEPYRLVVYLDDAARPAIREDLDDLFTEQRPPFVTPLAGLCGDPKHPAHYSYVPIGFARSAKVVLQPTASADHYLYRENRRGEKIPHIYYQITYRKLSAGKPVRPFSWQLEPAEKDALGKWSQRCQAAGPAPWPEAPAVWTTNLNLEIEPGGTTALVSSTGPGVITRLCLQTERPEALQILGYWDDAREPSIDVPFGPFFGCAESAPAGEVRGLWLGHAAKTFYCHVPMPFHKSARLLLRSSAQLPIRITGEIDLRQEPPDPNAFLLHAHRYDYHPPLLGTDYVVLDVRGAGHFVGLVMYRPGHMEGDDQFFVDDQAQPALHGTGTEDFFNFAWGLSHTEAYPLHGITRQTGGPVAYRFHLPAGVPFRDHLRITWEHGDDFQRGPNQDQGRYSGVVFYYAKRAFGLSSPPGS
jgi:hypothetical protein